MEGLLSTGGFGVVYKYGKSSAIKIVKCSEVSLPRYIQEIVLSFNHESPFIVRSQGFYLEKSGRKLHATINPEEEWTIYIKMPRMTKNLRNRIIKRTKPFPMTEVVKCLYSLAYGLMQLQNMKIAHRDIKPENILLDKDNNVMIADLGLSNLVMDDTLFSHIGVAGTYGYYPPELHMTDSQVKSTMKKKDLYKVDAWSLGITMLDMCLLKKKESLPKDQPLEKYLEFALQGVTAEYGPKFSRVLAGLLSIDPAKRKPFEEVLEDLENDFSEHLHDIFSRLESNMRHSHRKAALTQASSHESAKQAFNEGFKLAQQLISSYGKEFGFHVDDTLIIKPKDPMHISKESIEKLNREIMEVINQNASKHLSGISFDFSWCQNFNDECLASLDFQSLKETNIKKISLDLRECNKINDECLVLLATKDFKRLNGLESLEFAFSGCQNVTQNEVDLLVKNIGEMQLKNLSLTFNDCDKIDFTVKEEVDKFITGIKAFVELESLSLDFSNCLNVKKNAKAYIKACLRNLKSVEIR